MAAELLNPSFEDGDTGWTNRSSNVSIINTVTYPYGNGTGNEAYTGIWWAQARHSVWPEATSDPNETFFIENDVVAPVFNSDTDPVTITADAYFTVTNFNASNARDIGFIKIYLAWYDDMDVLITRDYGTGANDTDRGFGYQHGTVTATAPSNAARVSVGAEGDMLPGTWCNFDAVSWDYVDLSSDDFTLIDPPDASEYTVGDPVPLRVDYENNLPEITKVVYKAGTQTIAVVNEEPFEASYAGLPIGTHAITAYGTTSDGVVTSNTNTIDVVAAASGVEFKASNTYSYLVGEGFSGLASQIPSIARIVGVEMILDYKVDVLSRVKNLGDDDLTDVSSSAIFDVVTGGRVEAVLLDKGTTDYTQLGSTVAENITFDSSDFTIGLTGTSEGKKFVHHQGSLDQITIGSETETFGLSGIAVADFLNHGIGIRFIPEVNTAPSYMDAGDACVRFYADKWRLRVYFDAGTLEYYFASPDKTKVIKGTLVGYYVCDGDFRTGDASGELQLLPELEVMDGTQTWIGDEEGGQTWTIHSAYPPTDDNYIGDVAAREAADDVGMAYNGLPVLAALEETRSRYEMITNNFYGDVALDSVYGVHGQPRAFAYNGRFFHTIHTQCDPEKDKPRHVAHHHEHLALGFNEGRVDISVVGEPYNFDGAEGASSHTIGDPVVGLLPLSGTILGVFGKKSIWGISGTTVDNFATQVITPNIGAIEYTITDMGFPVYANAYGIYTLAQAQEYGDYLGTPMSQDVSPWLRPRLVRRYTSDKEVVVAWPVRSKNQYRLAFADGYVISMTLNAGSQSSPTFSFQQYHIWEDDGL